MCRQIGHSLTTAEKERHGIVGDVCPGTAPVEFAEHPARKVMLPALRAARKAQFSRQGRVIAIHPDGASGPLVAAAFDERGGWSLIDAPTGATLESSGDGTLLARHRAGDVSFRDDQGWRPLLMTKPWTRILAVDAGVAVAGCDDRRCTYCRDNGCHV
jgi:hypothetical protein